MSISRNVDDITAIRQVPACSDWSETTRQRSVSEAPDGVPNGIARSSRGESEQPNGLAVAVNGPATVVAVTGRQQPGQSGRFDSACRAGVSSPREVVFCMVSVLAHGSPRGPAGSNSGVRSLLTGPTGQRRVRDELPLPHLSERWILRTDDDIVL